MMGRTFWLVILLIVIVSLRLSGQSFQNTPTDPQLFYWQVKYNLLPKINTGLLLKAPPMTGAICRWEYQMEKTARLPLRFRLGCVETIERMEGKRKDWLHP